MLKHCVNLKDCISRFILVSVLLGASCSVSADDTSNDLLNSKKDESRSVRVTTQPITSLLFFPTRNAPAKADSLNNSKIPAQINAVLNRVLVKVGDQVQKGELLAELDCRDKNLDVSNQQAQFSRFEESLGFENRQLERGIKLANQKTIGEAELDNLKVNVRLAESQLVSQKSVLNRALLEQKRCTIRAPYHGVVTQRIASVGDMLTIGSSLLETTELSNVEVAADIPLSDSRSFEEAKSYFFVNSAGKFLLDKRVLLPLVLNESRSRQARLTFRNSVALPGTTGRLIWESSKKHIPANLLQERNGLKGVFILNENKAKFVEVKNVQEGRPILLNDFSEWQDTVLIIDGRHGLVDGQVISTTNVLTDGIN
ncbi:MAG: efflux RND transporter periplasmic adaptor subunit [Kangiellaceae bacterium]